MLLWREIAEQPELDCAQIDGGGDLELGETSPLNLGAFKRCTIVGIVAVIGGRIFDIVNQD